MKWFKQHTADLNTRLASALFDRSPDAILLMSGGQYVACNAAAETIYERPRPQIIGHNPMTFSAPIQETAALPKSMCPNARNRRCARALRGSNG